MELKQPAVFGRIVYFSGEMTSRRFSSLAFCPILVLRIATVIISEPEFSVANFVSLRSFYLPEPTKSLELKVRPAITNGVSVFIGL